MIKNKIVYIKLIILSAIIGLLSCETDLNNVGTNLIDNGTFETDKLVYEVIAYNQNVEKSRIENLATTNLGVLNHPDFGLLRAGFVTQVGLPFSTIDFGDNPSIDEVYIDIPYNYTVETSTDDGKPQFSLNNILGDSEQEFNLSVYVLESFLNTFDEIDPTQNKKYYSDDVYSKSTNPLYTGNFKPNANDTLKRIPRLEFTGDEMYDTIKKTDKAPSIKLTLDKTFFTNNFLGTANEVHLESIQDFIQHFNGLYFEVSNNSDNGALLQLDLSGANINFYYTSGIETDETDTDLNGDGDTDDVDIIVRTKRSLQFPISGVKNNFYEREFTNTSTTLENLINNPNTSLGENRLYLQGCAGTNAIVDIFNGIDLTALRQRNLLINEANLVVHIDKDISDDNDFIPNRLFLYKLDPDLADNIDENTQILDLLTEGEASFDGNATTETITVNDEDIANKLTYKFRITDYLSEVLKSEDPLSPSTFVLKTYHSTDLPTTTIDTIIKDYSWSPKGVVVYGNNIPTSDANYSKRLKLEVSFSETNN